jgi:hypothetical protein
MGRLRFLNTSKALTNTVRAEQFTTPTCGVTPVWSQFYSAVNTAFVGSMADMRDEVVPGFHRLSKDGRVFMNPMSMQKATISPGTGSSASSVMAISPDCASPYSYNRQYRILQDGDLTSGRFQSGFGFSTWSDGTLKSPNSLIAADDVASAILEASTCCLNKRGRSKSNLWETLAELDKSSAMLSQSLTQTNQFMGKNRKLLTRAKATSNAYLLFRYGLKPLISDVEAAVEGVKKAVSRVRETSRCSVGLSASPSTFTTTGSLLGTWNFTKRYTTSESLEVRIMSLDEYDSSFGFNLGLSGKGLMTLPWELMPYSFVLDWFANIGDFIGALVPAIGFNQLGSCTVLKRKLQIAYVEEDFLSAQSSLAAVSRPQPGSCLYTYESTIRNPGIVAPGLVIKSDFRFANLTRAGDAIALLMQKLR